MSTFGVKPHHQRSYCQEIVFHRRPCWSLVEPFISAEIKTQIVLPYLNATVVLPLSTPLNPPHTHTPPPPVLILVTADDEMCFNRDETDSDLRQLTLAETKRTNKYKQKSSLMTTVKGAGPKDLCLKQGFILTVL